MNFRRVASLAILTFISCLGGRSVWAQSSRAVLCPDGLDPVDVVFKNPDPQGHGVGICGQNYPDLRVGEKKHLTGIRVFSILPSGKPGKLILETNDRKNFLASAGSKGVELDELFFIQSRWVPTFRTSIECTSSGCIALPKTCIYSLPKLDRQNASTAAATLAELDQFVGPIVTSLDEDLIIRVAELALCGNKKAIQWMVTFNLKNVLDERLNPYLSYEASTYQTLIRELVLAKGLPS